MLLSSCADSNLIGDALHSLDASVSKLSTIPLKSGPEHIDVPYPVVYNLNSIETDLKYDKDFTWAVLLTDNEQLLQYVPYEFSEDGRQITVYVTHTNYDSVGILYLQDKVNFVFYLDIIDNSTYETHPSKEIDNLVSICMWDSPKKNAIVDGMICQSVCGGECGADPLCAEKQPGDVCLRSVVSSTALKVCDPNCDCVKLGTFESCSDNVQNMDEEEVDCGGSCAPCANFCNTGAIYAPDDVGHAEVWPADEDDPFDWGSKVNFGNGICDYVGNIFEVCSPELDYIIQEASDCCIGSLGVTYTSSNKIENGCEWAKREARDHYKGDLQVCRSLYLIRYMTGYGFQKKYMRYDFPGADYTACTEDDNCANPDLLNPDVEGLSCQGKPCTEDPDSSDCFDLSGWESNTDMSRNHCWLGPRPAHAAINIVTGGVCIDKSISLVTLLRKLGVSANDVFVINHIYEDGSGHSWAYLLFPGDSRYHDIETSKKDMIGYVYHSSLATIGGLDEDTPEKCVASVVFNDYKVMRALDKPIYGCETTLPYYDPVDFFCGTEITEETYS